MKNLISFCLLLLALTSCSPHTYLRVLQPADVTIPPHIKRIGIINRSLASKDDKWLNIMEGVLSGESIGADREGAEQAMMAVKQELEYSGRFIVTLPAVNIDGNTASFDSPLDYSVVHAICERHNLDGIVSMENFDSNSRLTMGTVEDIVKQRDGTNQKILSSVATVNLQVITKWRLYDDSTKNIVDNFTANNNKQFSARGQNPQAAQAALPYKRNAINESGFANGIIYGKRISPYWTTIDRKYYKAGSDALKQAALYTKKNKWNEAIEIWKKEMQLNNDKNIAGKACYNMAVACERDGNLKLALEYAERAASEFGLGAAHKYIREIKLRIENRNKLNYQMSGGNN